MTTLSKKILIIRNDINETTRKLFDAFIKTLEREHNFIIKDLEVNSTVETYKNYLILSFKGLELFLVHYMNFDDIKGFAEQQMTTMNKYEIILTEIGERNYVVENKKWPAELRLLGLIVMNTAMFLGTRYAMKSITKNFLKTFMKNKKKFYQFKN